MKSVDQSGASRAASDEAPAPPPSAAPDGGPAEPSGDGAPQPVEVDGPRELWPIALGGLFIIVLIFGFYQARAVIIPLVLAVLLSFLLAPPVRGLHRLRIPEPVAAAIVLGGVLLAVGFGLWALLEPASEWMDRLPSTLRRAEHKLRAVREPIERMSEATQEVEQLTSGNKGPAPPVKVEVQTATLSDAVLSQTRGFLVAATMVIVLLYFLLASGDLFLHKLVKVQPRFRDKKRAVEMVRQIKQEISTYLFTITAINAGLGVAVGIAMTMLEMPNPILWGVMAAVFNFVPYLGAIAGVAIVGLVAMATFDNMGTMIAVPSVYLLLTAIEGYVVTPLVLGSRLTLNAFVIFVGLIFWGWLWGIPGALLSVPIMAALKIIFDQIQPLKPVGEFMGR